MKISKEAIMGLLKAQGKSQKDLAKFMGWHHTSPSQMLHNGETKEETVLKIAEFLMVPKEEITLNFTPDQTVPNRERGELMELRYNNKMFKAELATMSARCNELAADKEKLEKDKAMLQQFVETCQSEKAQISEKREQLAMKIEQVLKVNAALKTEVMELRQELSDLRNNVKLGFQKPKRARAG